MAAGIVLPPTVRNQLPLAAVSPEQLILQPALPVAENATHVVAGIPATDGRFLEVVSGNAALSESEGRLALVAENDWPIVVKFRSANYATAMVLTAAAWIGLLVGGSVYFLYRKTRHA
jgi:hypothetical protein